MSCLSAYFDCATVGTTKKAEKIFSAIQKITRKRPHLPGALEKLKKIETKYLELQNKAFGQTPITGGSWYGGEKNRGNGVWYSDRPEVISATGGRGVTYRNNFPDFSPYIPKPRSRHEKSFDNLSGDRNEDFAK